MASFSFWLGLGALVGLGWAALQAPPTAALGRAWAGTAALAGALIGGRAVYVAAHWAYFGGAAGLPGHLAEIPQVWLGGLSGAGALSGGLLAVGLAALLTRQSGPALADALLPLLAGVSVAAWLGCWGAGVAYGPAVNAWYALPAPDEWGQSAPRLPLQPLAALLTVAAAWLAESLAGWSDRRQARISADLLARPGWAARRSATQTPGLRAGLALLGLGLIWLLAAALRADPIPLWRERPLDAWFGLGLALLAGLFTAALLLAHEARAWRRKRSR